MVFVVAALPPAGRRPSTFPFRLAGVVGWVSVSVYVPAVRLVNVKLPIASV